MSKSPRNGNAVTEHEMQVARMEDATGKQGAMTPRQRQAIVLLLSGCGPAEVAQHVGVCRTTLYNWMYRNERFAAALKSWERDVIRSIRTRLLGLRGLAFKAIATAIEGGDGRLSMQMFKGLGALGIKPAAPEEDKHVVIYTGMPLTPEEEAGSAGSDGRVVPQGVTAGLPG